MVFGEKTIQKASELVSESLSSYGRSANKAGIAGAHALGLHGSKARIASTAITSGIIGGTAGMALGTAMNIDDGFGEMIGGNIVGTGLGAVGGAGIGAIASAIARGKR